MATIPAKDMIRAREFHTEKLSLKIPTEAADGAIILEARSSTQTFICERGKFVAQHTTLTVQVEDLEATVDALIAKGITFE